MRLLVTGNGFDLAHNLPTSYVNFLCFCSLISGKHFKFNNEEAIKKVISNMGGLIDDATKKRIKNNIWVNYFYTRYNAIGQNWIDFENEIKEFCSKVNDRPNDYFTDYFFNCSSGFYDIESMKNEFIDLINLLNLYLTGVKKIQINCYYKQIFDFLPNKVINFNYTDTFKNLYYKNVDIDYVHGESKTSENTIVLGFDTLGKTDDDIGFAEFLKYFQMVRKKLELEIYREIQGCRDDSIETLFFGHSLDKNDKDIITKVIRKSKNVFILYHNEDSFNRIVKNLLDIYDKDDFMSLCLSHNKKIFFIQEQRCLDVDDKFQQLLKTFLVYSKDALLKDFMDNVDPSIAELSYQPICKIYEKYYENEVSAHINNPHSLRYLHALRNRCDDIDSCSPFNNKDEISTLLDSIKTTEKLIKGEPLLKIEDNDIY